MILQQLLAARKQEQSKQTEGVTWNRVFIGGLNRRLRR